MRTCKSVLILMTLLLTPSCVARRTTGPDSGTINFHASMVQTVLVAEASRDEILRGLGDAFRAGIISRPILEKGRALGEEAYKAIVMSKTTLAVYLRAGGLNRGSQVEVYIALATLSTLMAQLERFYVNETGSLLPSSLEGV